MAAAPPPCKAAFVETEKITEGASGGRRGSKGTWGPGRWPGTDVTWRPLRVIQTRQDRPARGPEAGGRVGGAGWPSAEPVGTPEVSRGDAGGSSCGR